MLSTNTTERSMTTLYMEMKTKFTYLNTLQLVQYCRAVYYYWFMYYTVCWSIPLKEYSKQSGHHMCVVGVGEKWHTAVQHIAYCILYTGPGRCHFVGRIRARFTELCTQKMKALFCKLALYLEKQAHIWSVYSQNKWSFSGTFEVVCSMLYSYFGIMCHLF